MFSTEFRPGNLCFAQIIINASIFSSSCKNDFVFLKIHAKWTCDNLNFFFMHFLCCDINARRVKQKTLIIRIHRLRLDIEKPIKNLFWSDQHADITPPPDNSWFKQRWIEFLIHSTDTIKCVWISNCSSRFIHASAIKLWTNSEVSTFFPDRSCRKLKTNWKFSQIKHFPLFLSQSLSSVPPVLCRLCTRRTFLFVRARTSSPRATSEKNSELCWNYGNYVTCVCRMTCNTLEPC